jgi:hypothetical protein
MMRLQRRDWLKRLLAGVALLGAGRGRPAIAVAADLEMPGTATTETFDFESRGIDGWTTVNGQWAIEPMTDAPSGAKVLVQRAARNDFNVIVAPAAYADVDGSVKFKPIAGREDASGGIVFRFADGKYSSSAPTRSKTTFASTTTIADDTSLPVRG